MSHTASVKYAPRGVPRAGYKTATKRMKEDLDRLYSIPSNYMRREMVIYLLFSGWNMLKIAFCHRSICRIWKKSRPRPWKTKNSLTQSLYLVPRLANFYKWTVDPVFRDILHIGRDSGSRCPISRPKRNWWSHKFRGASPTFTVYINVIAKEILRWNPSVS